VSKLILQRFEATKPAGLTQASRFRNAASISCPITWHRNNIHEA
jgi:hypothetical protein